MKHKLFKYSLCLCTLLTLVSCNNSPKYENSTIALLLNYENAPIISPLSVEYGKEAIRPEDPDRFNYVFKGWYEDKETSIVYNWNTVVNKDYTLYAKWIYSDNPQYKVTFLSEDGLTVLDSQYVEKGYDAGYSLATPLKASDDQYEYYFTGWSAPITNIQSDLSVSATFAKGSLGLTYTTEEGIDGYLVSVDEADRDKFVGEVYLPAMHEGTPVIAVKDQGFFATDSITNLYIGEGIELIKIGAFDHMDSLRHIYVPVSVTEVMEGGFYRLDNAVIYFAGNGPTSLYSAKWNINEIPYYTNVTSAQVSGDYEYIVDEKSDEVTIVEYIGSSLDPVMPDRIHNKKITVIGNAAFNSLKITSVKLGYYVKTIEKYSFSGCRSLTKVELSASIQTIGRRAFSHCVLLKDLVLYNYDTIETIEDEAFYGNSMLQYLDLRLNIKNMGFNVFAFCTSIVFYTEYIQSDIPETWNKHWNFQNYPVYYGVSTHDGIVLYDDVYQFSAEKMLITKCIDTTSDNLVVSTLDGEYPQFGIGGNAFGGNKNVKTITLSDCHVSAGEFAFAGCTSLSQINGLEYIQTFGENALDDVAFSEFTMKTDITYGKSLLNGAQINKFIDLGNSSIQESTCANCMHLVDAYLNEGTTTIDSYAFTNTPLLKNIVIPLSLEKIEDEVFTCTDKDQPLLTHIFYKGSSLDVFKTNVTIDWETNYRFTENSIYCYSSVQKSGKYWHYDANNKPVVWDEL